MGLGQIELADINESVFKEALKKGYSENQARIISSKLDDPNDIGRVIEANLNNIPPLDNLTDIVKGAMILNRHIREGKHVAIVTDSDMDGISSAYVLLKGMIEILGGDEKNLTVIINNRKNGNGITEKLLVTIMDEHEKRPIDLVVTGDHGSANGITIGKMKESGIEVIITDHHLVPETDNAYNADAFINPQKEEDCLYRFVSGCGIAFFLVIQAKLLLEEDESYKEHIDPNDYSHRLLPVVAASIVGDSMKLHDPINRALVTAGLKEMNSLRDPIWQAFKYCSDCHNLFTEEFLSFNLIPAINSSNRMGTPVVGFNFYNSKDYQDAVINFGKLVELNNKRKKLQKDLTKNATLQLFDADDLDGLTVVLEKGFGVEGIVSSQVGERFFKPTMTFVKHDEMFSGSGRSINSNFNLHKALGNMVEKDPDMFYGYGGHKEACGCKIKLEKINDFRKMFNEEAKKQLEGTDSSKKFKVIGSIDHEHLNESIMEDINTIAPFGIGFDKILYVGMFTVKKIAYVGREKESVVLKLELDTGKIMECFIYNSMSMFDHDSLVVGNKVKVVYRPKLDSFRGVLQFKLNIEYLEEA